MKSIGSIRLFGIHAGEVNIGFANIAIVNIGMVVGSIIEHEIYRKFSFIRSPY